MNVWTYWEGPRPPYIELCLRSMRSVFGDDCVVVTPKTVGDYISGDTLHSNYSLITEPALKADCIRAALLALHGGWWFDADTVAINPPPHYGDGMYLTWDRPPSRVLNGYIGLPPHVAVPWLDAINSFLDNGGTPEWCNMGEGILTPMLFGKQGTEVPRSRFLPVDIDSDPTPLVQPGDPLDYINEDTVCFGLNHSWLLYHHAQHTAMIPSMWGDSPLLFHRLLKYAHGRLK